MKRISKGVLCKVVGGVMQPPLNLGKQVIVKEYRGEHSEYGNIWKCELVDSTGVSEYGVVGTLLDFAESWLDPIDNLNLKNTHEDKEVSI